MLRTTLGLCYLLGLVFYGQKLTLDNNIFTYIR